MQMRHGECKTVGSKLVAVTVSVDDDGTAQSRHISGDFFTESVSDAGFHALLHDLERTLIGDDSSRSVLDAHPGCQIIGTDEIAIKTVYSRVVSSNLPPLTGVPAQRVGVGSPDVPNIPASINTQTKQPDKSSEYRERQNALEPQPTVIHDHPCTSGEQMAIDEIWACEVAARTRQPTIRLWEWAGPAVVIGRFQSAQDEVNLDIAKQLGFDVVRRCTGGGVMSIEPGNTITYSLYVPLDFVQGVNVEESYRLCDWWLAGVLRELGLDVWLAGLNDIASQYGRIEGAAQRRFPMGSGGTVLHHMTMVYDIGAAEMSRALNTSRQKMSDKAVKSAVKRVDPMKSQTGLSHEHIVEHLTDQFAA